MTPDQPTHESASDAAPAPHSFEVACDWCQSEVVSFAGPPAMIEITRESAKSGLTRQTDRICAFCHSELLRLIVLQLDRARQRANIRDAPATGRPRRSSVGPPPSATVQISVHVPHGLDLPDRQRQHILRLARDLTAAGVEVVLGSVG